MKNINNVDFNETVDSLGRVILYSEEDKYGEYGIEVEKNDAYKDAPFITLEKEDAQRLVDIINPIAGDDDVQNLGIDNSMSFERLIDRCDGLIYPATIVTTEEE